jgi:hypothetical protein
MLVLGALGWSIWFHAAYGSYPGIDVGDRITWCGHDFHASVTDLTREEAQDPPTHLPKFRYPPVWHQATVYAVMRTTADLAAQPGASCASELYLRTGPDRYTRYLPG